MWLSRFSKVSEASMRIGHALWFLCHNAKTETGDAAAVLLMDGIVTSSEHNHGHHLQFVFYATFLSTMSWPTGVIRNSKIFKAVLSIFSIFVEYFIMVCGQKRFSTSRTFKEEEMTVLK